MDKLTKLQRLGIKSTLPVIMEKEKEKEKMLPSTDDVIPKTEEEVIRVANCTYANPQRQSKYFLCNCSSSTKGFEPICQACAFHCHKSHHPTLEISGVNKCSCGYCNHMITQEMENIAKEKTENMKTQPQCFYSKFFDLTPNRGYYKYEGVVYCAVCVEYCLMMSFDDIALTQCSEGRNVCGCPQFHEINVIKLNAHFISRKRFHLHMRNFNYNILFKIPESKQIYIDALTTQINSFVSKKSVETNNEFFKNFIVFKVLELFSSFAVFWENKFFHVVPQFLSTYKMKDLFELMALNDLSDSTINEESAQNFISAKFYFAELLFNFIVRTYMLKYNNLWNFRTIINMNLYQRFLYIHNMKYFNQFLKEPYQDNYLDDLVGNILELYSNILKINEKFDVIDRIMCYVFPTFNRIMKYLIKYNILNEEYKKRYFDLVLETIQIHKDKVSEKAASGKSDALKDSSFYIMKSILYTIIYENDLVCIDYLNRTKKKKGFLFQMKEESIKFCTIFLLIIRDFNRKEDLNRTIMFDFYVRKFLEFMLDPDDFYINCVSNLEPDEINLITTFNPDTFYTKIKNSLDQDYYDAVFNFANDMNIYSRQYFSYDIQHENFCKYSNDIISQFRAFVQNLNINLDEISVKYCIYNEPNQASLEALNKLKQAAMYSLFFQKIEEFIHIYSQGKIFPSSRNSYEFNKEDLLDNLQFLLKLLFALCNRDFKYLTLVSNLKPKIFIGAFYDTPEVLLQFLARISEMIYSELPNEKLTIHSMINGADDDEKEDLTYKYDNYYFFSEWICELLIANDMNIAILSDIMAVSIKSIHKITLDKIDFVNAVEEFSIIFEKLSKNQKIVDKMVNFLKKSLKKKEEEEEENKEKEEKDKEKGKKKKVEKKKDKKQEKELEKFIISYYEFMSELYENDMNFFDYLEKSNIIPIRQFKELYLQLLDNNFDKLSIQIKYVLTRYYFNVVNPFSIKMSTIKNQIKNLFMEGVPDSVRINLSHLSKRLLPDVGVDKVAEMKGIFETFLKVLSKFDLTPFAMTDKIFLLKYYEKVILRPLYLMFSVYILHLQNLKGVDCKILLKVVKKFFKVTAIIYQDDKHIKEPIEKEELKFSYEEICVRTELTQSIIDEINDGYQSFKQNKVQYFQLRQIYEMFHNILDKLFDFPSVSPSTINQTMISSLTNHNEGQKKVDPNVVYRKKLIEKYKDLKGNIYNDNIPLVFAYQKIEDDLEAEPGTYLAKYFQVKFCDSLTDLSLRTIDPVEYENENSTDFFKIQNLYILKMINNICYYVPKSFREGFAECSETYFKNFFPFVTEKIIVSTTLNELIKLYTLDGLGDGNENNTRVLGGKECLSFELGKYSIKLFQNLCEGNFQKYQSVLFDLVLDPDEYLTRNKNIYDESESKNQGSSITKNLLDFSSEQPKTGGGGGLFGIGGLIQGVLEKKEENKSESSEEPQPKPEDIDEEEENEEEQSQYSKKNEISIFEKQTSFFNLISYLMKMINFNINITKAKENQYLQPIRKHKSYDNIIEIYQRYSDLIIEMIQGTESKNFKNFYDNNLPVEYQVFLEDGTFVEDPMYKSFVFLSLINQIQINLFSDYQENFNKLSFMMKINIFVTLNNILSQKKINYSIVKAFFTLLPCDKLIDIVSRYLRGLYVKYIKGIVYEDPQFLETLSYLELDQSILNELTTAFKTNFHIYEDDGFKLASQIFLFITILGKRYNVFEAQKVLKYSEKSLTSRMDNQQTAASGLTENYMWLISKVAGKSNENTKKSVVKLSDHNYVNDYIVSCKFFSKVIKQCEFKVEKGTVEKKLDLKVIYYIVDPHFYYISKTNIDNFYNNVDRSSETTKLKALISEFNLFMTEVEYKSNVCRKSKYIQWFLGVNFKTVYFYNFIISLIINFILLLFLTDDQKQEEILRYLMLIFGGGQCLMNIIFVLIFIFSKYKFYVLLSKNELGKKKNLTIKEAIRVYVLDSFFLNDEVDLLILIIVLGIAGIVSKHGCFFFDFQLLTALKFISTIKEILIALQIRMGALICMMGFLAILVFFYANIGFYFLIEEFNVTIDGEPNNFCKTLLECSLLYFNHAVRSGGGIGDIIGVQSFNNFSLYMVRWTTDIIFYITVILLLLNMINGYIVSAFSQIREERSLKEEDINNKCFICNIDRIEFEKKKISFKDHQKYEHNLKHYIKFLIMTKRINESDLDADQSFIMSCIKNKDIKCFPVNCATSLRNY